MSEQALTKRDVATIARITTPDEFRSYVEVRREQQFHVLTPMTDFGALAQQWALVPTVVMLNPDVKAGDAYFDRLFCEGDEVALSAVALRKIGNAGGVKIATTRLDSGTVRYYWSFKAVITFRSFVDATEKTAEGTSEYDLTDGSPRVNKMIAAAQRNKRDPSSQIEGARMHGLRGCEARAINAAIRGAFSLKQKYTKAELAKPFVAFNLVFQPDMKDPQQKAAVLQGAGLGSALLGYPPAPAEPVDHAKDAEVIDTTATREPEVDTPQSSGSQPLKGEVPFDDEETAQTVLVSGVSKIDGTDDYFITTDVGRLHTSDIEIAKSCNNSRKAGTRIKLEIVKKGDGLEIVEVTGTEKL